MYKYMFISKWWIKRGGKFNVFTFWADLLMWVIPISFVLALIIGGLIYE